MNDESFLKEERTQASEYFKYCSRAQGDIADTTATLDSSVLQQALTASVHASEIEIALNTCIDNEQAYKDWLGKRSPKEPRTGKCDAILFAAIPGYSHLISDIEFIRDPHTTSAPPTLSLLPPTSTSAGTKRQKLKRELQSPFFACTTESWIAATRMERKYDFKTHLILPHAVAEYKKYSDDEGKALNQGRMYLVSLVAFYSALGIEDYPFFSLVTSGKLGAILMAWKSSRRKASHPSSIPL